MVRRYHWWTGGLWHDLLLDCKAGLWNCVNFFLVIFFSCKAKIEELFSGVRGRVGFDTEIVVIGLSSISVIANNMTAFRFIAIFLAWRHHGEN